MQNFVRRFFLVVTVFAVAGLLNLVSACAPEVQEETFAGDFVSNEEPDDQGLATFGEGVCKTSGLSEVSVFVDETGLEQTCNGACMPDGCRSFGEFETAMLALELDDSINPQQDCFGNCGPMGISVCGYATLNGQPFPGRWICLAWINGDGLCHMKAVPNPCGDGKVCENSGVYPNYGVCDTPEECVDNADCGDANQCTADTCVAGFCQNELLDGNACDDGDACTDGDICNGFGDCVAGPALNCNDGNACTTDSCDQATGCAHSNVLNDTECDDSDACTEDDLCTAGVCIGAPRDCNDSNSCTTDSCDPVQGCVVTAVPNEGIVCDDSDMCTTEDTCLDGECSGTDKNCNDLNSCTTDSCNPLTGDCLNQVRPNGAVCGGGVCVDGICMPDGDWCTDQEGPECRTAGGNTQYWVCTVATQDAVYGVWELDEDCGPIGGAKICAEGEGCVQPAACMVNADCLDTNLCNGAETCVAGACVAGVNLVCNDGNACTTDSCDPLTGCKTTPVVGCCLLDADCAVGKVCTANVCVDVPSPLCNAGDCPAGNHCEGDFCVVDTMAIWCWDGKLPGEPVAHCHTFTGVLGTYWSPPKWLFKDNVAIPPQCGSAPTGINPPPVQYPAAICCVSSVDGLAECLGGSTFKPYAQ